MGYELNVSHETYIEVTANELITKDELIKAISMLMLHDEYTEKHVLWNFSEASWKVNIGDLREVLGVVRLYKPETEFANKSAIVVPDDINRALVEVFIMMTRLLPFDCKVFRKKEDAVGFISSE